jgi:tRNA(adenine34) deaminase
MPVEMDEVWMRHALSLADKAADLDEVPVGAVLVRGDELLGEGWNQVISARDPSAHAEMVALRNAAAAVDNYRLPGTTLYVTLEPCTMCVGALIHARIERLVYAAAEPKAGVVDSNAKQLQQPWYNHCVQWQGGLLEEESRAKLQAFFHARRQAKKT